MVLEQLPPNLHFMSIGSRCYFILLKDRVKGPFDNIFCNSTDYLLHILQNDYLNIFLNKENVIEEAIDQSIKHFLIPKLGIKIMHNDYYSSRYLKNHIERVKQFYDFLNKVSTVNNYFFLLCVKDKNLVHSYAEILYKYNLMDKTFVFTTEEYASLFTNAVIVKSIDDDYKDWDNSVCDVLSHFENYTIEEKTEDSYIKLY